MFLCSVKLVIQQMLEEACLSYVMSQNVKNPNFAEFLAFLGLVWICFPNLSQKDPSFGKLGYVIKIVSFACLRSCSLGINCFWLVGFY